MDEIKAKIEEILKCLDDLDGILEQNEIKKGQQAERIIKVFRKLMTSTIRHIDSMNEESE